MGNGISDKELFLKLEDLDVSTADGITLSGSKADYIDVLHIACDAGRKKIDDLKGFLLSGDINNYTILVHSIKSGLANIGALHSSELAKKLETAGKNNDRQYIVSNHNGLISEYAAIIGVLEQYFGKKEEKTSGETGDKLTEDEWQDAVKKAEYYADELEFDLIIGLADMLLSRDITSEQRECLANLKQCADGFDMEKLKVVLSRLKTKI